MSSRNNYVGRRNGSLEVIIPYYGRKGRDTTCWVRCDCGVEKEIANNSFKHTLTCGTCGIRNRLGVRKRESYLGHTFGFLEITKETPAGRKGYLCDCLCLLCGNIKKDARLTRVKLGEIVSCGCYMESMSKSGLAGYKHGYSPKNSEDVFYTRLCKIHDRCFNPSNKEYPNYGGRGIDVWEHWSEKTYECITSFKNYLLALYPDAERMMMYEDYEIDRYPNNDFGYYPGNIRLALTPDQNRNKRTNIKVIYDGVKMCAAEAYRLIPSSKASYGVFVSRLKKGESVGDAARRVRNSKCKKD